MDGRRRIDRLTAEGFLDRVAKRPLPEIREMRREASEEEALLSYERRLLHGRLAILRAELERRRGGGEGSLVADLPEILAGDERGPSRGQFPTQEPRLDFEHPKRRVTRLVSDDTLAQLPDLADADIERIVEDLSSAEHEVSTVRRKVLDVLDALNAELGRRYRSGEADPSDVLSQGR